MIKKQIKVGPVSLIKQAASTFVSNPVVLVPFITIAFLKLLLLEIFYFAPRYPLSVFFGPIIRRFWGEAYMHYPFNFAILPQLIRWPLVVTDIFLGSFFIAMAISIIYCLNNNKTVKIPAILRTTLAQYVHIIMNALLIFGVFYGLYRVYGLAIARALKIASKSGIFYIIKVTVLQGAPYVNLLIGVFVTALFAFVLPIIIIEKKKIHTALIANFKNASGSYVVIFALILIPTLFYIPVVLLRNSIPMIADSIFPGLRFLVLVLSVFVITIIDAIVYTSITMFYLLKKENK